MDAGLSHYPDKQGQVLSLLALQKHEILEAQTDRSGSTAPSMVEDIEHVEYSLRSDDQMRLTDSLAGELLGTRHLRRLRGIGFLGAIDYMRKGSGRAGHRRRHNRLEHSMGVALLAEKFAMTAELDEKTRLKLVAAALLHDIGHGPLSHTLEPVFEEYFEINHHNTTHAAIRGESRLGSEVREILQKYKIDPEEIIALIDGEYDGPYGYLFSAKINLDTLEGITRCRAIVGPRPAFGTALAIVERWAQCGSEGLPQEDFDDFWTLKHQVYSLLINSSFGLAMDTVAQAWAKSNISALHPEMFELNESALRSKHPELFQYIRMTASPCHAPYSSLPKEWLATDVQARRRKYYVNSQVCLDSEKDIPLRYKQEKKAWTISLEEILSGLNLGDHCDYNRKERDFFQVFP